MNPVDRKPLTGIRQIRRLTGAVFLQRFLQSGSPT